MATKQIAIRLTMENGKVIAGDFDKIGQKGKKAFDDIEKSSKGASRSFMAFNGAAKHTRSKMGDFANKGGVASASLRAIGVAGLAGAAGLGALIIGLSRAVSIAKEATVEFEKIGLDANKLGISTDELQELSYAALKSGIAQNTMTMAVQRFTRRVEEARNGTGEALGILTKYNIQLNNSNGTARKTTEILGDVAEKMKGMATGGEKLRMSFKLFDSEGAVMVNMLGAGKDAFEGMRHEAHELGVVIDESMIKKAQETATQAEVLSKVLDVNLKRAFVNLAPILNEAISLFSDVARAISDIIDSMRSIEDTTNKGLAIKQGEANNILQNEVKQLDVAREKFKKEKTAYDNKMKSEDFFYKWMGGKSVVSKPSNSGVLAAENNVKAASLSLYNINKEAHKRRRIGKKSSIVQVAPDTNMLNDADAINGKRWATNKLKTLRSTKQVYDDERAYAQKMLDSKVIDKVKFDEIMLGLDKQYQDKISKKGKVKTNKALNKQISDAKKLYEDSLSPLEKYTAYEQELLSLKPQLIAMLGDEAKAQKVLDKTLLAKQDQLLPSATGALRTIASEAKEVGKEMSDAISGGFATLEDEIVAILMNSKSPLEALSAFINSIAKDLLKMGVGSFIGKAAGWLEDIISPAPSMNNKGGVFSGGMVMNAKGRVVNSPKTFMNNGVKNMMSENKREAIMPLLTDKNGNVGISAIVNNSGANNTPPNVTIAPVFNIDGATDAQQVAELVSEKIRDEIPQAVNGILDDAQKPGGRFNL